MDTKYDVVIIGSGIGGLVCGCYLAKAGLRVLISEQHASVGGYCTSFERNSFIFDVAVHYLGSCREGGLIYKILHELDIKERMEFIINDPCDRIITPDKTIFIRKDRDKTKQELISNFPKEKENINRFFKFVLETDLLSLYAKTKKISFKELLDIFFKDYKLKSVLSMPLINLGLPSSKASALISVILYREYILDPGYYPKGGIQKFPLALASKFKEYGGNLLTSARVDKILTKNKKVIGIKLYNGTLIFSNFVVSNADATSVFRKLLDCNCKERSRINKLEISPSAFVIYLGLNKNFENSIVKHYVTFLFSTYDIEKCYTEKNNILGGLNHIICSFPSLVDSSLAPRNKSVLRIFVGAKYANANIWEEYKDKIYIDIMEKISTILPDINDHIEIKEMATPHTFYQFTSSRDGAIFGWASTKNQVDRNIFPTETSIKNLYLAGHWVTNGIGQSGVPVVALSGKLAADKILNMLMRNSR